MSDVIRPLIAGNWKMNGLKASMAEFDAMLAGARTASGAGEVAVEPDRRRAIDDAVDAARPGDVVVIAGKGHEQGQEQNGVVVPFDDRDVLRDALRAHGYASVP